MKRKKEKGKGKRKRDMGTVLNPYIRKAGFIYIIKVVVNGGSNEK